MNVPALLSMLEGQLEKAIPGWAAWARWAWCRKQRRCLCAVGRKVLWVHDGDKVPWALWGADKGYFEVDWAGRLPYLRTLSACA